jgi:hypothetical protein
MSEITEAEETFCMFKLNMTGGFISSLIQTMFRADRINQSKLSKGFPELMEVIDRYGNEPNYWENLVDRWNKQHPPTTHKLNY